MGLTGLDPAKMALVIEAGWRDLDAERRERVMAAADARGGFYHQWRDNGDGTISVSWSGVELARVEMFRDALAGGDVSAATGSPVFESLAIPSPLLLTPPFLSRVRVQTSGWPS